MKRLKTKEFRAKHYNTPDGSASPGSIREAVEWVNGAKLASLVVSIDTVLALRVIEGSFFGEWVTTVYYRI